MGGFSYRGKNIGDFGEIYYAPDASERGEYALPYKVYHRESILEFNVSDIYVNL